MCIDDEKLLKKERTSSNESDSFDCCASSSKCHVRECNSFEVETVVNATVFTEGEVQEMIDEGIINESDESKNGAWGKKEAVNFKFTDIRYSIAQYHSQFST